MKENLGKVLQKFFSNRLVVQLGRSPLTVKSYRDAMKLLLRYTSAVTRKPMTALSLDDFSKEHILRFLSHLEKDRGNTAGTRNQRLAMLHVFFEFVAEEEPGRLFQAQQIAGIRLKRAERPARRYIERELLAEFMRVLPRAGALAARDRTLILFLYNTGARAQEVANVRDEDVDLASGAVHLKGKRNKERVVFLWPATRRALRELLASSAKADPGPRPLFRSQRGGPLTRLGVYRIVRRHAGRFECSSSAAQKLHFTPHLFRHTMAVHQLEAKVDPRTIQVELGHARLSTTDIYATATVGMRAKAMRATEPDLAQFGPPSRASWRSDPEMLRWLESL